MTGDRLALAIRVRKARHASLCAACGSPILIGAQIARLIKPSGWCHIECVPVVASLRRQNIPAQGGAAPGGVTR